MLYIAIAAISLSRFSATFLVATSFLIMISVSLCFSSHLGCDIIAVEIIFMVVAV